MTADVAVVGDGIAGLTVALECAAAGLGVIVCGASLRGGASVASAGVLGPSVGGRPSDDPIQRFMIAARDAYPTFLARLLETTGMHVPTIRGIIQFPESNTALDAAARSVPPDATFVGRVELAELEPALPRGWVGLFHTRDGAVDVSALLAALMTAVDGDRRISRRGEVARLHVSSHGPPSLEFRDGSRLTAGGVAIANGAWAGTLHGLSRALPVIPLKGEIAFASLLPIRHVVFGGGGYLVPRGREMLVGATSVDDGFDASVTASGTAALARIANIVLPDSAPWEERFTRRIAGLRPVTPDLLPILGPDPEHPSVVYACGYSRNGVLLAPLAAACVAASICEREPELNLAPFSPARFSGVAPVAG